ncbi:hypothetical protein MPTK1_8g04620 [Marchantia polymorpha subsp. ruderalis]|uniref:Uncharacterized protein n=1 Tax=Marchantia polymorpha TaxID=3197 RepID=A0A2R6W1J1_MARPO|nr:hypothetical protein MARPO_0186s0013 [Marchantia polymorpha]BBN18691.1 hypothetical protein Mp_8g04620 [Marchantia polymorpha subsp. ruderalis]|eukprot:PTQ27714.1 hypothetical protein MARPO_0186s0013 [Marchantia polymorpha]
MRLYFSKIPHSSTVGCTTSTTRKSDLDRFVRLFYDRPIGPIRRREGREDIALLGQADGSRQRFVPPRIRRARCDRCRRQKKRKNERTEEPKDCAGEESEARSRAPGRGTEGGRGREGKGREGRGRRGEARRGEETKGEGGVVGGGEVHACMEGTRRAGNKESERKEGGGEGGRDGERGRVSSIHDWRGEGEEYDKCSKRLQF